MLHKDMHPNSNDKLADEPLSQASDSRAFLMMASKTNKPETQTRKQPSASLSASPYDFSGLSFRKLL